MTRLMACPHCGHTCKSDGIGAVYCGPHGNGQTYHPAVRMEQIEPEGHAEDHLDAATVALENASLQLEERRQHELEAEAKLNGGLSPLGNALAVLSREWPSACFWIVAFKDAE